MGDRDDSHSHASRCAPTHVEAGARVVDGYVAQLEREFYDESAPSAACRDAYAVARDLGYRKGHNDRTRSVLACLRELRQALVVETVRTPVLFEGEHVPGEWET